MGGKEVYFESEGVEVYFGSGVDIFGRNVEVVYFVDREVDFWNVDVENLEVFVVNNYREEDL